MRQLSCKSLAAIQKVPFTMIIWMPLWMEHHRTFQTIKNLKILSSAANTFEITNVSPTTSIFSHRANYLQLLPQKDKRGPFMFDGQLFHPQGYFVEWISFVFIISSGLENSCGSGNAFWKLNLNEAYLFGCESYGRRWHVN